MKHIFARGEGDRNGVHVMWQCTPSALPYTPAEDNRTKRGVFADTTCDTRFTVPICMQALRQHAAFESCSSVEDKEARTPNPLMPVFFVSMDTGALAQSIKQQHCRNSPGWSRRFWKDDDVKGNCLPLVKCGTQCRTGAWRTVQQGTLS